MSDGCGKWKRIDKFPWVKLKLSHYSGGGSHWSPLLADYTEPMHISRDLRWNDCSNVVYPRMTTPHAESAGMEYSPENFFSFGWAPNLANKTWCTRSSTLRRPQKRLVRLIDKYHLSHAFNSLFTFSYNEDHDSTGIKMSSIKDMRPNTDGLGSGSGLPSVKTSF